MQRHSLIWRLALASLLVFSGWPAQVRAGCGTAACPLDLNQSHEHRLRLQAAFEHIDQNRLRAGTDEVAFGFIRRPDHDEIETLNRNLRLRADYALNQRWSLAAALPLLQRRHSHIAAPGHNHDHDHDHETQASGAPGPAKAVSALQNTDAGELQEWNFTRPGDLVLWARFTPSAALAAALGVSLPTGSTTVENEDGDRAEPSLQPGRGAWGLVLEASVERVTPHRQGSARLFASTSFRANGRGPRDYRFGNEWLLHTGGSYPLAARLELLGQLAGTWRGRDDGGRTGEHTDATGGTGLYLSPGLRWELGAEAALYGYYQFPLYENLNQIQLTAARNLLVGLDYQLDLF